MKPRIDLTRPRRIHVIGAGGVGMSAVAGVLAGMGHEVTGSDLKPSPSLDRLRLAGVGLRIGHRPENVGEVDAVTVSSAVPASNLEIEAARARGIDVLTRAETLASIAATRRTIAVAGTHGKTTSASMLSLLMIEAGLRPSFIIGGELNEIGTGAVWDEGDWLVVEADESDGSFLALEPEIAIVTSVEPDHLDHYGGFDGLVGAFERFLSQATAQRIVSADDPTAARLGEGGLTTTFGTNEAAEYRIVNVAGGRSGISFAIVHEGSRLGAFSAPIPGEHNARNAAGAVVAGLSIGVGAAAAQRALGRFTGVARRYQFRGEADGVTFVDDYAHLPTEVRAALGAARAGGWDRVVCLFQPHRYSRTAILWESFADAFEDADVVLLTDVYPAGERPRPGVSGELIAQAVRAAHPRARVEYLPTRSDLLVRVPEVLRPGDLCLTLGAGDLTSLPDELMSAGGW